MRRLLFVIMILFLVACGGAGAWYWSYVTTPSSGKGEGIVLIPKGTGVRGIGRLLADQGLLRYDIRYLLLVYFSGLTAKLHAGEYGIPRGLTPPEVLRLLEKGTTLRHHVTVPEGVTVEQVAAIFEKDGWIKRKRFLEIAHDATVIKKLGIEATQLEGYLFPETYTLVRNETDEYSVVHMMVAQFFHVWNEVNTQAPNGLNRHQLVTLASVVEKETAAAKERPLIARVFLNRLALKMRLQSDPTVSYGIPEFKGELTKADLKRETPYNTYVIPGLPVGPICNPGRASLEAVLHPADSSALYFVSKNDGTHYFSDNLAEHNRAVKMYQRNP